MEEKGHLVALGQSDLSALREALLILPHFLTISVFPPEEVRIWRGAEPWHPPTALSPQQVGSVTNVGALEGSSHSGRVHTKLASLPSFKERSPVNG